MTPQLHERIDRVCDGLVQTHLDLLIALLASRGVDVKEQRDRADLLVRSLLSYELVETIMDAGRRIPLELDTSASPPLIKFNAELVGKQSDGELRILLTRPIAQLTGLSTLDVGMALQGDDETQIRNLYHSATRSADMLVAPATGIPAVVERRVMLFALRLRSFIEQLAGVKIKLPSPRSFVAELLKTPSWPDWDDVADNSFPSVVRERVDDTALLTDALPPTELILEICWDSLNLSPRSFLRHAGRALRSRNVPVGDATMSALIDMVAPGRREELDDISTWPALTEIADAWKELMRLERRVMRRHQINARDMQSLPVLTAPIESTGLREPRDLPWDYPLACWSLRESNAMRDLLNGYIQSYKTSNTPESMLDLNVASRQGAEMPLDVTEEPGAVRMEMIGQTIVMPEAYEQLSERAYEATIARLVEQFELVPAAKRNSILQLLRGGYDGFFPNTKHVWERRLQGWESDPPELALRRLATATREVLGCPVFLNPFFDPVEPQTNFMPTFCFVVALTAQMESVSFHVPVSSVVQTAAAGQPPLRVRMVEVSEDPDEACLWCGDRELTVKTIEGQPVKLTLSAVTGNMLRLLARD